MTDGEKFIAVWCLALFIGMAAVPLLVVAAVRFVDGLL